MKLRHPVEDGERLELVEGDVEVGKLWEILDSVEVKNLVGIQMKDG